MATEFSSRCAACGAILPFAAEALAPDISVVVPVFNEGRQLNENLASIRNHVVQTGLTFELILIDDGSSDNTWELLHGLQETFPEIKGLRLSRNFGKEAALSAGLDASRGRACIVMDADLQHPPALLPEMIRLWRDEGWEIVEGVKATRGRESWKNRLGARLFYYTITHLSGYHLRGASDFKLLDRKVVTAWQEMSERNTFFRGMVGWVGYRRKQLPFEIAERLDGLSKWSFLQLFRLAITAITAFSSLPLQLVTLMGGLFLLCSFFFAVYAVTLYFHGLALPGFTTVILLQLIIGGVLMVSLGIIGTYIARVYEETKRRPRYLLAAKLGHAKEDSNTCS
ncbi:MAG TPA: glycosyltransferase family 2 protein [Chthoniobacterales bacterium]|jgi:dolichol-phosphate mannosyltransferase